MKTFIVFIVGGLLFALGLTACVTSCEKNRAVEINSVLVI